MRLNKKELKSKILEYHTECLPELEEIGLRPSTIAAPIAAIDQLSKVDLEGLLESFKSIIEPVLVGVRQVRKLHTPEMWKRLKTFELEDRREHNMLRTEQTKLKEAWRGLPIFEAKESANENG